jgi:peptidoglycan/LPS O-acetylase OafA/YrhL
MLQLSNEGQKRTASGFRPEIQGLRALAVGAVILNHVTGWPGGAFVGVDVFFVISGFLITGLLLKERQTTGRISLGRFYKRRFRRIIPATIPVLLFTVVASFCLLNAARGKQALADSIWALFFSANWHLAAIGTDYFEATGPPSPFEHFWSLAVEEQFYLVWPLLIVIIFAVVSRRVGYASRVGHRLVGSVMAVVIVVSFVYACLETISNPTWAYFSTFDRAWELGVGALLAAMSATLTLIPGGWRPILAWLGLTGIVASMFAIGPDMAFPAPWAALPVLSTAMVIAAGTGGRPRFVMPLTHPVSVWIGELSYSLYLWHLPIIIGMAAILEEGSIIYNISCLTLILAFSVTAFYVIEDPVRKSSWLLTDQFRGNKPTGRELRAPWTRGSRSFNLFFAGFLAFSCAVVLVVGRTSQQSASSNSGTELRSTTRTAVSSDGQDKNVTNAQSQRTAAIATALSAARWPTLNPSLGNLKESVGSRPCALTNESPPIGSASRIKRTCYQGDPDAEHTILVVGDSLANSYVPSVVEAVAPHGWSVASLTRSGCPAIKIEVRQVVSRLKYPNCDQQQEMLLERIGELKPDLILLTSSTLEVNSLLASDVTGRDALDEWSQALQASVTRFAKTAPVVVVQAPPRGADLNRCATRFSKPADCVTSVNAIYTAFAKTESKAVKALDSSRVRYVKTRDWFCSEDVRCPSFVEDTPVFADGGHLTVRAARQLGPVMFDALDDAMRD